MKLKSLKKGEIWEEFEGQESAWKKRLAEVPKSEPLIMDLQYPDYRLTGETKEENGTKSDENG